MGPGPAAKAVTYRGELTLEEDLGDPQKTLLTYQPTVVPKSPQVAAALIGGIRDDFNKVRIPFLEKVSLPQSAVLHALCSAAPCTCPEFHL